MAWHNDLVPIFGSSVTIAVALYGACRAAEKDARSEALLEIGGLLRNRSWSQSWSPAALIEMVFHATFGDRQLSWRCIRRSFIATGVMFTVFGIIFHSSL